MRFPSVPSVALALLLVVAGWGCDRTPASTRTTASAAPTPAASGPRAAFAANVHYLELLSGGARAEERLPMVVAIHGLGDRPERFAPLLAGLTTPARLIVPRGLSAHHGGFSWFPFRAAGADPDALAAGIRGAADALAAAIAQIASDRPTRGRPVVVGFSQGGMLSFALAVHHPEVVGAAFPVAGMLPPPLWPETDAGPGAPPIEAFHGDADDLVPIARDRETTRRLVERKYRAVLHEARGAGHTISPETRAELLDRLDAALRATRD